MVRNQNGRVWRAVLSSSMVALALFSGAQGAQGAASAPRAPAPGSAPNFVLPAAAGGTVSLEAFRGRPALVNFWASWCPGCRAEMPELEALSRDRPRCLAVIGIAEDSGGPREILAFARAHAITYPLLLDDGRAAIGYGVVGIPYSVLIDAHGRVVRVFTGQITREVVSGAVQRLDTAPRCQA